MKQLLSAVLIAVFSWGVMAAEPAKKQEKKPAASQKAPAKKQANDPKWKNNSLAKKQAECRADPSLAKCAKKTSK